MITRVFVIRAWRAWSVGLAIGIVASGMAACKRTEQQSVLACASDSDCGGDASLCRIARCRKPCDSGFWVGQAVKVTSQQGIRTATISDCDIVPIAKASSADESPSSRPMSTSGTFDSKNKQASKRIWVRYDSGVEQQTTSSHITTDVVPAKR